MPETFVIVGSGQAGAQAAGTLREHGFRGRVILVGDESLAPYQRPPLSKKFLEHLVSVERLYLRSAAYYENHRIELRLHAPVEAIDRAAGRLHLRGGTRIAYDKLLICTGSRPRTLDVPGSQSPDVHYLRTLQDALRLRGKLAPGRRVAIVGGGYIGLEVAATASAAGALVTVLESSDRILGRVTSEKVSRFFAEAHRRRGVDVRCNVRVTAFEAHERLSGVRCDSGLEPADLAVVGVGAVPNAELAQAAGLPCDGGILVDEHCRTADPLIFAAGDCTSHPNALLKRRLRLESVQNAIDQAQVAALNMCGESRAYAEVPWFWSQQYEFKLQSAGMPEGYDDIEERGSARDGSFALLYRRNNALLAVDAVNMPREYMAARKRIAEQGRASPLPGVAGAAACH
jgi:3-phenylpropionate/trans-cinnamate dioxygenase ferredoxin reductase subunit